ncbi:MAG: sensor histidine kinase [Oscillospiraceae bacterium]
MPNPIFKPYKTVAYPCFLLQANGQLLMNDCAKAADPPFSDAATMQRLLTVAAQELARGQGPKTTLLPLLTGALGTRTLTLIPLEQGLLAVATHQHEAPATAFSSQIRDPLTNIFATLPLITKRLDDPDLRYTDEIQANCYQLLRLANNLETAARLERRQFDARPLDLTALVSSLCFCADSICKDQGIPIEWHLPDTPLAVRADARLLGEGILNLLRNSLQYTRDGNHITVRLKTVGAQALLTVEDAGLGVLPENLERIFEPYFSVDPYGDSHMQPGLGLGLAVARQIFTSFGGSVAAESQFGKGTRISVALPLDPGQDDMLGSDPSSYLLNRYSPVYIQLCGYCRLPNP